MIGPRLHRLAALLLCVTAASGVAAEESKQQDAGKPQESERGIKLQAPEMPDADPARPALDRTPVLPSIDAAAASTLATVPSLFVSKILLEGNTVLAEEDVGTLLRGYQGREVTVEELHALRQRLSQLYFDRGYVNSGVVIPDQDVEDGQVIFRSLQGALTDVEISGNRSLRDGYLERRVRRGTGTTLQINELQQSLEIVQQDPLIRRVQAQLVPGDARGQSGLKLAVTENSPWLIAFAADNHRPPSTGEEQLSLSLAHRSLTGHGDVLSLQGVLADGLDGGAASYSYPLNARDTSIRAYYSRGNSQVVEEPFDRIDIESRVRTVGLSLTHPIFRTPSTSIVGQIAVESKHSESTLLGIPFSFSRGERNGEADTTALQASIEWNNRSRRSVLAVRTTARLGVDALDATINPTGPDGEFLTLVGQLQYGRRLNWRASQLLVRSTLQLAVDPLLGLEKLPVGGADSVRGYRDNLLVRDNGAVASLEWRLPLFAGRSADRAFGPKQLNFAPFVDYGRSWDEKDRLLTERTSEIYSAGLGLIWRPWRGLDAEVYWGEPLEDELAVSGDSLQDDGVHFRLSYQLPL